MARGSDLIARPADRKVGDTAGRKACATPAPGEGAEQEGCGWGLGGIAHKYCDVARTFLSAVSQAFLPAERPKWREAQILSRAQPTGKSAIRQAGKPALHRHLVKELNKR